MGQTLSTYQVPYNVGSLGQAFEKWRHVRLPIANTRINRHLEAGVTAAPFSRDPKREDPALPQVVARFDFS
jgi:hypothetical protein